MGAITSSQRDRIEWLDLMKAFALLWIFINHLAERLFGYPMIANPGSAWPPLVERVTQLAPLQGYGIWTVPANALRYFGWFGDQGVQLFLIVSGFGLTWGFLRQGSLGPFPLKKFYLRRAERIYPLWWGAHIFFAAIWLITGWGISATNLSFYLSFLGIRLTSGLLYYFSPAWWYFGLLVQLYLIYPLLWKGLRGWGPTQLLVMICASTFLIRGIGIFIFESYLDPWLRGAFFITRLPEFVFGISLAAWMFDAPQKTDQRLRSRSTILFTLLTYILGTTLSLTLLGMIVAPFLLGISAFIMVYAILVKAVTSLSARMLRPAMWTGQHSYSLYLMHHPWIILLVPLPLESTLRIIVSVLVAVVLTLISAVLLEWGVKAAMDILSVHLRAHGIHRTLFRLSVLGVVIVGLLIGIELLVQRFAPQEVLGWGERPSLEADEELGWHLIPNHTTHLRWESYDYRVTANSLGFPEPSYPELKDPGKIRVFVTGDAFTSAEGVNTDEAWPRLLEKELAEKIERPVEVLNYAITGYGPNQYAAVVDKYAPVYLPDLILVATFVNDFQEVLGTNTGSQQSIGFGSPAQFGPYATLHLEHLRRFMRLQVVEPIKELVRGKPRPHGYFLGNFSALEKGHTEIEETRQQKMAEQLSNIKKTADQIGVPLLVVMVPAPVQVCGPDQLAYYPRNVDLTDTNRYDLDLPQHLMSQITSSLGLSFYDLRPVMDAVSEGCPYQTHNMHWTKAGHQAAAVYLADILAENLQEP